MENKHNNLSSKGKTACTKFTRVSTNGNQSIVLCEPITGRTHQVRILFTYYIATRCHTSQTYCTPSFTPFKFQTTKNASMMQIRVHLQYTGHPIANDYLYLCTDSNLRTVQGMSADRAASISVLSTDSTHTENPTNEHTKNSVKDFIVDPMCTNCPNLAPKG